MLVRRPDVRPSTADSINSCSVQTARPACNEGMGARRRSVWAPACTRVQSTNSATSLAGYNRAVRCSNRQSFEPCFQTNVFC